MEDKHLSLKHRFAFGAVMSAFFSFSLLVYGPLSLYVTGNDEMWFSFRSLLLPVTLISVTAFVIITAVLSLPKGAIHKALCCLIFGIALGLYIQCGFFNISYGSGVLDGSQIAWKDYTTYGAIDSAMWAACLALPFALFMVFKNSWRHILMVTAAFIMVLQIGGLAVNIYQNQSSLNKLSHEVTTEGMYELSDKDNTLVFVLSSVDNSYYAAYKNAHPEAEEALAGFTEYNDTLATGAGSMVSFPSMLTGDIYKKDIRYTDFIDNTWGSYNVFDLLRRNGVDARVYADEMYFGSGAVRKVNNVVDRVQDPSAYRTITSTMYRYTMYNAVPHYLKRFFWMSLNRYSAYKGNTTYDSYTDAQFFKEYDEHGGFTYSADYKNAVRVYNLTGAKEPYRLNAKGERVKDGTNLTEQVEGEFYYVLKMIDDLKKNGLYESARIIITADNGDVGYGQNPVLLYKDRGATAGYKVSDAPVSMFDLPATLASIVSEDYSNFGSGISFTDAERAAWNRRRFFYRNAGSNADSRIEEYKCNKPDTDTSDLVLIKSYYINGGKVDNYVLGTELTFTEDETAAMYCQEGFGHTNGWRTIMRSSPAVMEIPIDRIPDNIEDLHVYFNVLNVYEETRCVIKANGKTVYDGHLNAVTKINGLNFLVPTYLIGTDKTLELKFTFPELEPDTSSNIIALAAFKIYHQ